MNYASPSKCAHMIWMAFCLSLSPAAAQAQSKPYDPYERTVQSASEVKPLDETALGESINYFDGTVRFEAADLQVPGNSSLRFEFRRSYEVVPAPKQRYPNNGTALGDWDIDIPRLTGTYRMGDYWYVATNSHFDRCSSQKRAPTVLSGNYQGLFGPSEYWDGVRLHIPGKSDKLLLVWNAATNASSPTDGTTYKWSTSSNWFFSCSSSIAGAGAGGESFVGIDPEGTKYYFNTMVRRMKNAPLTKIYQTPYFKEAGDDQYALGASGAQQTNALFPDLDRWEVWLAPSMVVDRFGNWVAYDFDTNGKLTKMRANDGRQITITYGSNSFVSSVSDQVRTVTYAYDANGSLTTVTFPNSSKWQIGFQSMATLSVQYTSFPTSCADPAPKTLIGTPTGWITSPSGLRGDFSFAMTRHNVAYVPKDCLYEGVAGAYPVLRYNRVADVLSLKNKVYSGPGVSARTWGYQYISPPPSWASECSTPCASTKETRVTLPDGSIDALTFGDKFGQNRGRLLVQKRLKGTGEVLATTSTSYFDQAGIMPGAPKRFGLSNTFVEDTFLDEYVAPVATTSITQQNTTFTASSNSFDKYGLPLSNTRSSSGGAGGNFSRSETTTYYHDTAKWAIGQVATTTETATGKVISQSIYDAATALPFKNYAFGLLKQTLTYNNDGTVATVADGRSNVTLVGDWYRHVPRLITHPTTYTQSATVNPIGRLLTTTDEVGSTQGYSYDSMGWLANTTYPTGDSVAWNASGRSFVAVNSIEYGIPSGHWRQTVTTGNGRTTTYYDATLNPVLILTEDIASGASRSFVVKRYDAMGRLVFSSYPVGNLGSVSDVLQGTSTEFDALGRVSAVKQNSELGLLTSTTEYLPGFQIRTTNSRGYQTTTSYQTFDSPDTSNPVLIQAPEGVTTTIARDVFGKPLSVTRSGPSG